MAYCAASDLKDTLHEAYLEKIEELNPGSTQRHIDQVSSEIDDALRPNYRLPLALEPPTLKRICGVLVCYRLIAEITSLMKTEAMSQNEWIPLQSQYKQAMRDLEAIRQGKPGYGLEPPATELSEAGGIRVAAPAPLFGPDVWRKF